MQSPESQFPLVRPVDRVAVPFHGLSEDSEELTWGQWSIWGAMEAQRSWLPIPVVRELAPGATVADAVEELRYCLHRYDSLRTRLAFDAAGEPRQVVAGSGELMLDVFEAGDADPATVAAQVRDQYRDAEFDFARDWPVRTGVVLHRGEPSRVVALYSHLAMDGAAMVALLTELASRSGSPAPPPDSSSGSPAAPPDSPSGSPEGAAAMRPVELARWERSEAGQRANAASLRHWEKLVRELPTRRFAGSGDPQQPRYWQAGFESRALHLALQLLARRTGSATATLLAVLAVALGRVTGDSPVVAQVVVGNRFRPHLADVFAPVNQPGVWAVDVAGGTLDELLRQSRRRAMSAYKHAYYHPREQSELLARLGRERGEPVALECFVNDRRLTTGNPPEGYDDPTLAQVQAALAETRFEWRTRTDTPNERLFLHVEDVPDTVSLTIWVDTHTLGPANLTAVLRELEAAAIAAAFDPAAPTGVGTTPQPPTRAALEPSSIST